MTIAHCARCNLPLSKEPNTEDLEEYKTTSTDGEMVYVQAPPFHEPAQAVSQSIITPKDNGWEKELSDLWEQFPTKPELLAKVRSLLKISYDRGVAEGRNEVWNKIVGGIGGSEKQT